MSKLFSIRFILLLAFAILPSAFEAQANPRSGGIVIVIGPKPPTPVFTYPAEAQVMILDAGATITVGGYAEADGRLAGLDSALVQHNGGPFLGATLGLNKSTWSRTITPTNGVNTVTVQVYGAGRSGAGYAATRTFTVQRALGVNLSGAGTVTAGFSPTSVREVGRSFSITATPVAPTVAGPGSIFVNWAASMPGLTNQQALTQMGVPPSALEKRTLTFIFREGLVLTANFATNSFPALAGNYHGLVRPSAFLPDRPHPQSDGTTSTNATEGRFSATVQNTGAFSGTLTIDGLVLAVAGAFDMQCNARFGTARLLTQTVARPNKPGLNVALHLDVATPGVNDKITGTVTATDFRKSVTLAVSDVDSDRAFYNGTTQVVPTAYLGADNANGMFTAIFPPEPLGTQTAGLTKKDYPQGIGTATVTISKGGVVTLAGVLADNTALSVSSALSQDNTFPLFAQLYNKLGFLSGYVQLDGNQNDSDMAGLDLQWLRPFQNISHYYPAGWMEGLKLDFFGARYRLTTGQSVLKLPGAAAAPLPAADADGNARLGLAEGRLSDPLERFLNLSAVDAVTKVPGNDPTFTLNINRTTGAISGTFDHTDDTKPTYTGIIYQKGTRAGGWGFFMTKQPNPITYDGESGAVILIGQP